MLEVLISFSRHFWCLSYTVLSSLEIAFVIDCDSICHPYCLLSVAFAIILLSSVESSKIILVCQKPCNKKKVDIQKFVNKIFAGRHNFKQSEIYMNINLFAMKLALGPMHSMDYGSFHTKS